MEVSSRRNKYIFDVKRKYTFILGDSGTGKTKLGVLLKRSKQAGGNRIRVNCSVPVVLVDSVELMEKFYKDEINTKAIYVIDEDVIDGLVSKDSGKRFAECTEYMSAYFVLMSKRSIHFVNDCFKDYMKFVVSTLDNCTNMAGVEYAKIIVG